MGRWKALLGLVAVMAMVATACGDSEEVVVTSIVERPGETVAVMAKVATWRSSSSRYERAMEADL